MNLIHKKGRPSKAEQIQIKKVLQPFFERMTPAYKAAQITGYDTKTVNKYYDEFFDEISRFEAENLSERLERERKRFATLQDDLIYQEYEMLEIVRDKIRRIKNKDENRLHHLIDSHSKIIRNISYLGEKRVSALISPSMDSEIDKVIEKRMAKHVQLKPSSQ